MTVILDDIRAARTRIAGGICETACVESIPLSELCGAQIFCKLEYMQRTGSFKERGARNALLLLTHEQQKRGAIAASAGNHALGMAYHGRLLGIPVTVVMPTFAPLIKVANCRKFGATVVLHGKDLAEARTRADELAHEQGLTYVHGYDDAAIITGQGTIGLEILEQVPDADAIVASIGGGGMIAGIALAVKSLRPDVQVIGVEPEHAACFSAALAAGEPVDVEVRPTLADGLAVSRVGPRAFEVARRLVDRVVVVDESALAIAMLRMIELDKRVVEGAGAAPLAAFIPASTSTDGDAVPSGGQLSGLKGKRVVLVLSGGNVDLNTLDRVIETGLVHDARICRFTAVITDRPGGLAGLAGLIASTGASIKDITHDRLFAGPDVSAVRVVCTVEIADREHRDALLAALRNAGVRLTV